MNVEQTKNFEHVVLGNLAAQVWVKHGEVGLLLFLQLTGNMPCEKCGYVKKHCRCVKV